MSLITTPRTKIRVLKKSVNACGRCQFELADTPIPTEKDTAPFLSSLTPTRETRYWYPRVLLFLRTVVRELSDGRRKLNQCKPLA